MQRIAILLAILFVGGLAHDEQNNDESDGSLPTSLAGLENLLETERDLIQNLENYGKELLDKLSVIRSAVRIMREENDRAMLDPEEYLENPINTFSLIRRMQADWKHWEAYMRKPVGEVQAEILKKTQHGLPAKKDLTEAIHAMHRIQETYGLNVADMTLGLLNRRQYKASMSSLDCATIGSMLLENKNYHASLFWLYAAIQLYQKSEIHEVLTFQKRQVLELYAENMRQLNRFKDALQIIEVALREQQDDVKLLDKKAEIERLIETGTEQPIKQAPATPTSYQLGCRGEYQNKLSKMYCVYNTTTTPFLKLAPLKMEIVHLDPYMVLYHDVISDPEIEELKELARPELKRATVYSKVGNGVDSMRTSKFAWLIDNTSPTTLRLNQRIADMTGFDLRGSEMLQVMNYGLGGHYSEHYDFFNVSETADVVRMTGDRISTVLFYMSNLKQGGATVFPNLQTAVFPQKGTAIIWYNLNNRGDGDWKTLHAACPVLVGSKWVVNKWVRERQQAFRRPCYKE